MMRFVKEVLLPALALVALGVVFTAFLWMTEPTYEERLP